MQRPQTDLGDWAWQRLMFLGTHKPTVCCKYLLEKMANGNGEIQNGTERESIL